MSIEFLESLQDSESIKERLERFNEVLRQVKLGRDMDGTEIDSFTSALNILNEDYGTSFKLNDLKYDFAAVDLIAKHIPQIKDPMGFSIDLWNSDRNLGYANPVPGALSLSKYLFDNDAEKADRISSRPSYTRNVTYAWYERIMPWIEKSQIHIQDIGNEIGIGFKIGRLKDLHIEWFLEDSVKHSEQIIKETNVKVLLMPQSSNENYKPAQGSRIYVVPKEYHPELPTAIRAHLRLADLIMGT